MKKLLISIVIILLLALTGITIVNGFEIGNLTILGISQIKQKNEELDSEIEQATKLSSTDYQKSIKDLNDVIKKLEAEKQNYEEMASISTDGQINSTNTLWNYKIEYLWVKIGNHAKNENVEIRMEVSTSTSGAQDVYDLNFTATGPYIGISDFISDIEEDTALGFRIEDFKMMTNSASDTNSIQATFTCRDISIQGISQNNVNSNMTDTTVDNNDNTTVTTEDTTTNNVNNANEVQ